MSRNESGATGDARLLHQQAVRIPFSDDAVERQFHHNMEIVAKAQERKAEMILDPDVSMLETYETQLERLSESYRNAVEGYAGEQYEAAALAYSTGDRDDGIAALAAYLLEAIWRMEQMFTIHDLTVFPLVLRYPNCCTVNVRFVRGRLTEKVHRYESPEYSQEELDEKFTEIYHSESRWSQKQAAKYIESTAEVIREQFPDPREVPFEERSTGGIVSAYGRRGSEFCSGLEAVSPDPTRFEDSIDEPALVTESPLAKQTAEEWLDDDTALL